MTMIMIAVLFLFIALLISFYFIALLNVKVSKFDDLELRQSKLMREMDDSIGAYLAELKDENDRLIKQLVLQEERQGDLVNRQTEELSKTENVLAEVEIEAAPMKKPTTPMNHVLKSYGATTLLKQDAEQVTTEVDDRKRSIQLYDAGYSIEEIAKTLGKGRTEVELILKFR